MGHPALPTVRCLGGSCRKTAKDWDQKSRQVMAKRYLFTVGSGGLTAWENVSIRSVRYWWEGCASDALCWPVPGVWWKTVEKTGCWDLA